MFVRKCDKKQKFSNVCRFKRSENATHLLYVVSYGKVSLELREVCRNAFLPQDAKRHRVIPRQQSQRYHAAVSVTRFRLYLYDYQRHAPVSVTSLWRKVTQQRMNDQHTFHTLTRSCDNHSREHKPLCFISLKFVGCAYFPAIWSVRYSPYARLLILAMCVYSLFVVQCGAYYQRWIRSGRKDGFIGNPPSRRLQAAEIVPIIDQPPTRLPFHWRTSIYEPRLIRRCNWYSYR